MISIVTMGRNDSYGYNLHKRVAISLNCLAVYLRDRHDEIIFVDYNTPDSLPTLPEAISDTLTSEARCRLRVLRVRPAVLDGVVLFEGGGMLAAIAYNIGFRRTNPANRWLLATTTDNVLVPSDPTHVFSEALRRLSDGFYSLPRYEAPQLLWESLNRTEPHDVITVLHDAGRRLHLREKVLVNSPVNLDNCGDFQLMLREDLFAIDGMDERMVMGWQHTDANLEVRLGLLRGIDTGLSDFFDLYHLSHQRSIASTQARNRIEHDWEFFVSSVTSPQLPSQADSWGLPNVAIEEIRIDSHRRDRSISGLIAAMGKKQLEALKSHKRLNFDSAVIPVDHVLPHLADQLACLDPRAVVGYLGANRDVLVRLTELMNAWARPSPLAIRAPLDCLPKGNHVAGVPLIDSSELDEVNIIVVDFSVARSDAGLEKEVITSAELPQGARHALALVHQGWHELVEAEQRRAFDGRSPRIIIIVNAIHTSVEPLITRTLVDGHAPFSTRLRAGTVAMPVGRLMVTERSLSSYVESVIGRRPSSNELSLALTALMILRFGSPAEHVPERMLGPVLSALLDCPPLIRRLRLDPTAIVELRDRLFVFGVKSGDIHLRANLLSKLTMRQGAKRRANDVIHLPKAMPTGIALFGPYARLDAGTYVLSASLSALEPTDDALALSIDVACNLGQQVIARTDVSCLELNDVAQEMSIDLPFELSAELAQHTIEFRIWRHTTLALDIVSMMVLAV